MLSVLLSTMLLSHADPIEKVPDKPKGEIWVMVVDSGISENERLKGYVQFDQSIDYKPSDHGTHVAGLIIYGNHILKDGVPNWDDRVCSQVKIFSCNYYDPLDKGPDNLKRSIDCIDRATRWKMDYINYSGGGTLKSEVEYNAIKRYSDSGGVMVVAAGNEGKSLNELPYYPASYKFGFKMYAKTLPAIQSLIIVEALDQDGKVWNKSSTHPQARRMVGHNVFSTLPFGQYGYMSGTSQAAPGVLHTILKQRCEDLKTNYHLTSK